MLPLLEPIPQFSMPSPLIQLLEFIGSFASLSYLCYFYLFVHFFQFILNGNALLLHFHVHHHLLLLFLFCTLFVPFGPRVEELGPINFVDLCFYLVIEDHFVVLVNFIPMIKI